ncbi:hypothetical protein PENTCL1PPCAC_1238, partial [Pristionchus entomophagus]
SMDNRSLIVIGAVIFLIALADPANQEKINTTIQSLGYAVREISIAIGVFLGMRSFGIPGICSGGLLGVCVGKALNHLIGEPSYDIIVPTIIAGASFVLDKQYQLFAVAAFALWWRLLADVYS